jgi:hypothetical protein
MDAMRYRLRRALQVVGAAAVTVVAAVVAAAIALYLTGPVGAISCVPAAEPAARDPLPRWILVAGIPAVIAALVGAFFALAGERVLTRIIGVGLVLVLAAVTFCAVYILLPAACRPSS